KQRLPADQRPPVLLVPGQGIPDGGPCSPAPLHSYTEFGFLSQPDTIELAVCDISSPSVPSCHNGGGGSGPRPSYMIVQPAPSNGCENEGSYPAVDLTTGDVYVAFEHNWATNVFNSGSPCASDPVREI